MLRALYRTVLVLSLLGAGPSVFGEQDEPAAESVPDMPSLQLADPEMQKEYDDAVEKLSKGAYKDARDLFRRLKAKVDKPHREAVERGILEAEGGLELDKATEDLRGGKPRRVMVRVLKLGDRYHGTKSGLELAKILGEAEAQIYFLVADFEKAATTAGETAGGPEPEPTPPGEPDGGTPPPGGRGGETGHGLNTRIVEGTPEDGLVRTGKGSLSWRTGRELSFLTFPEIKDRLGDYRYLNISIRSDSDEAKPNLVLLLDTLEGELGGPMGGGRRGGGRAGAAWVYQREGFHTTITPQGKWQDLRLDLSKFTRKGEVTLEMVLSLRIVHMPGVSATILIDDVRLEKE